MKPFFEETATVELHPWDAGSRFGNAPSDVQAAFLNGTSRAIKLMEHGIGSWAMQCRAISTAMPDEGDRQQAVAWLETLLEHLCEPVEAVEGGAP